MEYLTMKQVKSGKGYISYGMREELEKLNLSDDVLIVNFAYTDYGGDFFDKVAIEFFSNVQYNNCFMKENTCYFGKNGVLFGSVAKDFIKECENYPLGYEDIEDFYYELQYKEELEGFKFFLNDYIKEYEFNFDDVLSWLMENKGGYYSVLPSGLDFCSSTLEKELVNEGLFTKKEE